MSKLLIIIPDYQVAIDRHRIFFVAVKNGVLEIRKLLIIKVVSKCYSLKILDYQAVIYSHHTFFTSPNVLQMMV